MYTAVEEDSETFDIKAQHSWSGSTVRAIFYFGKKRTAILHHNGRFSDASLGPRGMALTRIDFSRWGYTTIGLDIQGVKSKLPCTCHRDWIFTRDAHSYAQAFLGCQILEVPKAVRGKH